MAIKPTHEMNRLEKRRIEIIRQLGQRCQAEVVREVIKPLLHRNEIKMLEYLRARPLPRPRGIGERTCQHLLDLGLVVQMPAWYDRDHRPLRVRCDRDLQAARGPVYCLMEYRLTALGWQVLGYDHPPLEVEAEAQVIPLRPALTERMR